MTDLLFAVSDLILISLLLKTSLSYYTFLLFSYNLLILIILITYWQTYRAFFLLIFFRKRMTLAVFLIEKLCNRTIYLFFVKDRIFFGKCCENWRSKQNYKTWQCRKINTTTKIKTLPEQCLLITRNIDNLLSNEKTVRL